MSVIDLIQLIGDEGESRIKPSFFIAKIIKSYPDIELKFNNIILKKEQISFTSYSLYLASGFQTEVSDRHNHKVKLSGINEGDDVLIYKLNDEKVLIIDKVVV